MKKGLIIGIAGKAGAGKDTVASMLSILYDKECDCSYNDWVNRNPNPKRLYIKNQVHFADALKHLCANLLDINEEAFYDRYYKNADLAYAYKLGAIYTLKKPLSLLDKNIRTSPPQTFRYLTKEQFDYIKKNKVLVSSGFRRTIFLAGIHAVGKTTFAKEKFSSKYEVVTASLLIKNGSGDVPLNKKVHDINKNQLILIYEFNKLKKFKKNIVLDGHFCLLDKSGNITYIPVTVFKKLGISHIILLETHPKIIQQRLLERDKTRMSLEKIIKLLEAEREHALYIAHKLKIPITLVPDTRLTEHAILDR